MALAASHKIYRREVGCHRETSCCFDFGLHLQSITGGFPFLSPFKFRMAHLWGGSEELIIVDQRICPHITQYVDIHAASVENIILHQDVIDIDRAARGARTKA